MADDKRTLRRTGEILRVFARHNFYVGGLSPRELRTSLEDLGPMYVKIGQIMSSRTDLLPPEYCEELSKLRSEVVPLPADVVRHAIEQECGGTIEELYASFDDEPIGAASVAQAHRAVLHDGREVVTKVQRPGIVELMHADLEVLRSLAHLVGVADEGRDDPSAVDLVTVVGELAKVTREELDFRVEAANTREFRERCITDETKVSCPEIVDELTGEHMLTMTYVPGYSVGDVARMEREGYSRVKVAEALTDNYLYQVLDVGVFHGDPHQGNIIFSGGVPYWIDFGMMGRVSASSMALFEQMMFSLAQRDADALAQAALSLGTVHGKLDKGRLTDDMEGLIERYGSTASLAGIDMGALMQDLMALLQEHDITLPGEYTMLVRSLVTFEGVLETLAPEMNLLEFLSGRMIERARDKLAVSLDMGEMLESVMGATSKAGRVPGLVYAALNNLVRGRTKVSLELTNYEECAYEIRHTVFYVVLAAFACVLFFGSCVICTTDIEPRAGGMPVISHVCFVLSAALAIFSARGLARRRVS